jgi:hypothetical protein
MNRTVVSAGLFNLYAQAKRLPAFAVGEQDYCVAADNRILSTYGV